MNDTFEHPQQRQMNSGGNVLSQFLFAAFAIPVSIVMINVFWPAGFVLAIVFAALWPIPRDQKTRGLDAQDVRKIVHDLVPTQASKTTGNASFDAYKSDVLDRLEQEQNQFDTFLTKLRDAKDESEFDRFMDARASRIADQSDSPQSN